MRWRNTAVYLAVLLVLGGYFYHFEVVKKERREAEEKAARRVFAFKPDTVSEIVIDAKGQLVRLEKKDTWRIVQPVGSEVDRTAFETFFGGLKDLELVRKLGPASEDPKAYGLVQPALAIRFQAEGQAQELLIGDANPAGDARYAQKGGSGEIFLIDQLAWQSLNKTLKDLRKKELFTWQTDQVLAMEVEWRGGEKLRLERSEDGRSWKETDRPGLRVKTEKVERFLDQFHWLRAVDFLDDSAKPNPPAVKVTIKLKGGAAADIVFGDPDQTAGQVVALSSGLPVPVKVASNILKEIPASAEAVQDRSLLGHDQADVRELKWKRAGAEGSAVRTDPTKWESGGKPLVDPWRITALIEEAAQVECLDKAGKAPELSGADLRHVEFLGAGGQLAAISWAALPEQDKEPVTVRLEQAGKTNDVLVKSQDLRRLDDILAELAGAEPETKAK